MYNIYGDYMATKKINNLNEITKDLLSTSKDNVKELAKNTRVLSDDFKKELAREVDKANKRLSRMNNFQKNLFADKGITHISRKGDINAKLKALSQAKIVNESGISTKKEYNDFIKKGANSLGVKYISQFEELVNDFDIHTRDFVSGSTFSLGSPLVDFGVKIIEETSDRLGQALKEIEYNTIYGDELAIEIYNEINRD